MNFLSATEPGSRNKPNEDWSGSNGDVAVLLDGLTAPEGLPTGCIHGVPWFVKRLGENLLATATRAIDLSLADCLKIAIKDTADIHRDSCDLASNGTPSATAVVIRVNQLNLEYLVLSDSSLVIECDEGIVVVCDKSVERVAVAERKALETLTVGSFEHSEAVLALVRAQRLTRNVPGGYWIAAAKPEAATHSLTGVMPISRVRRILLLSDGAACLHDVYEVASWPEIIDLSVKAGPSAVLSAVRAIESDDLMGRRWARFKSSDDATVVFGECAR